MQRARRVAHGGHTSFSKETAASFSSRCRGGGVYRHMDITINTEQCGSGIQKASSITPSKSGNAYLKTMWLKASKEKGTVCFMTTDASTEYTVTAPAEVKVEGLVGVNSKAFTELVRSLPAGLLHIKLDEAGQVVQVSSSQGKRLYKLPAANNTWFQEFTSYPEGESVIWNGEVFSEIIKRIYFCLSEEEESSFSSLCIRPNSKGSIDFCGLDGNKFAISVVSNQDLLAALPEDGITIQRKHLSDMEKLLDRDDIELNIGEKRIYIRTKDGNEVFSVPLTQLHFIDYSIFLNKSDGSSTINVKKQDMLDALSRSSIFNTKDEIAVYLAIREDSLTLTSSEKTLGSATETIPADCQCDVPELAFVTRGLIDILQHMPGDDVVIRMSSKDGPCAFTSPGTDEYMIIAMPMQVVTKSYYDEESL